jgi:hypothetical protein
MAAFSDLYWLHCTRRAAEQAAANLHIQLSRGITGLGAIACTAPLVGMCSTAVMLRDVPGCGYGDCAGSVAATFVPFALSLAVSALASGGFHYLRQQMEAFDLEVYLGILKLLDHLGRE